MRCGPQNFVDPVRGALSPVRPIRYFVGMYNDYSGMAGLGIGVVIFGIVLYLGTIALMLWVGYLLMRTAVKNGILRADAERASQRPGGPYAGPPNPQQHGVPPRQ